MSRLVQAVALAAIALGILSGAPAYAEPTSGRAKIATMRAYVGGAGLITTTSNAICDTSSFKIDLTAPGGKEAFSAALAAHLAGRSILIEVSNSTGCTGNWTLVQSITVLGD